ncbi:MAG TPA: Tim44/TimA family putative adaptor protein [Aliidongia sp.]|nr:Tim44/TimA family putative adaptor protein [Aliidongia sp.]
MGDQVIDIILFAMVAAFLVFRLWSVLGRRTGNEHTPSEPRRPIVGNIVPRAAVTDNVVALPDRSRPMTPPRPATPLDAGLAQIRAADPHFRIEAFIDGARHAFDLIVKSYADGDTATLRPLLSDEVYDVFAEAIRHRLATKETVDTRVVSMRDPEAVEAGLDGRTASITIKFVSNQISATRNADGKVVEGDPDRAAEHTDSWTFSRNVRSSDPNWILVSTGHHE